MTIDFSSATTTLGQATTDIAGFVMTQTVALAVLSALIGGVGYVLHLALRRAGLNKNIGPWEYYRDDFGNAHRYRTNEKTGVHYTENFEGRKIRRRKYQLVKGKKGWQWGDDMPY